MHSNIDFLWNGEKKVKNSSKLPLRTICGLITSWAICCATVGCGGRESSRKISLYDPARPFEQTGIDIPTSAINTDSYPNNPMSGIQVLPPGQAGEMRLPIREIYNQGISGWCWAFAAFHTLRTYYYNAPASDSTTVGWRQALESIDSRRGLTRYLESRFGSLIGGVVGGDPQDFIDHFKEAKGLADQNWQQIDTDSQETAADLIAANIRQGIPSVFCTPSHCRMVFGFVSDGARILQFTFADSSAEPPGVYNEDVAPRGHWGADEIVTFIP